MFRCQKCGRVVKHKAPSKVPFCGQDGTCKNVPLPRCKRCNSLQREEKSAAKYATCPHSAAPGSQHDYGEVV